MTSRIHQVFDDFTGEKYALIGAFEKAISIVALTVLLPIFLNRFAWHETALELVICGVQVCSLTCAAFATNMIPQFALALGVSSIDACQWALVRSVFTKMVDPDEVGKVFSFVAILAATLTLVAIPAVKKLYNATLAIFPSTFLLVAAGMYLVTFFLNLVLFSFRSRFDHDQTSKQEEQEERKDKEKEIDVNANEIPLDSKEERKEKV